jgi:hypothetical protein
MSELDPEDPTIVTPAPARARVGAADGTAVRDTRGRTDATVALPSSQLTGSGEIDAVSLAAGCDRAPAAHVLRADPSGAVVEAA